MSTVKSDVDNILAHKIGIKFNPPSLVLLYELKDSKQFKKRLMPIRNFSLESNVKLFGDNLKSRHAEKLSSVPNEQIEKMLKLLKDYNRGIDLQTSLKRLQAQDEIFKLSNEDEEEIEEDFGVQIESPVWRKEDANFWND
ncbi:hypothetical protein M8J75_002325 [Diaphorina citri]|nr:hypothetical protein M8J75_002325 [Diaphorina citri]